MLHIAGTPCASPSRSPQRHSGACPNALTEHTKSFRDISPNAHAGSRTRVTSMGGLYDAATLRALTFSFAGRMIFTLQVLRAMRACSMSFCLASHSWQKRKCARRESNPGHKHGRLV